MEIKKAIFSKVAVRHCRAPCSCHSRESNHAKMTGPLECNATQFIVDMFKTDYNLEKGFQARISPVPDAQQTLRCGYIETLLQSPCDWEGVIYSQSPRI